LSSSRGGTYRFENLPLKGFMYPLAINVWWNKDVSPFVEIAKRVSIDFLKLKK